MTLPPVEQPGSVEHADAAQVRAVTILTRKAVLRTDNTRPS